MKLAEGQRQAMNSQEYLKYLLSDVWLARKKKYYETHDKKCYICSEAVGIDLHHCSYKRLGKEEDSDLVPLCKEHHKIVHVWARGKKSKKLRQAHGRVKEAFLFGVLELGPGKAAHKKCSICGMKLLISREDLKQKGPLKFLCHECSKGVPDCNGVVKASKSKRRLQPLFT